jgi:iron complex transport system substrate-binding protein
MYCLPIWDCLWQKEHRQKRQWSKSLESLYKYNPDHIFLGYYAGGGGNTQANLEIAKKKNADLQSSELFKKLKAYETGNVYSLEYATWSLGTYPLGKEQALEKIRDIILKK